MTPDLRAATTAQRSATPYAGVASRAVALAVDAALAHLIVGAIAGVLVLVASLVGGLHLGAVLAALAAAAWVVAVGLYFVVFWASAGQTPGMRLMGLRVTHDGQTISICRATARIVGLAVAIAPLFLGFVPVLFDRRRRGLHDFLARTVVRYDAPTPVLRVPVSGSRSFARDRFSNSR